MKVAKSDNNQKIIDNLCQLVYERKFKQAEEILLQFLEETVNHANGMATLTRKKEIIQTIYHSFNCHYYKWGKKNNINVSLERKKLNSQLHNNFLISHAQEVSEMDDLLHELVFYNNLEAEKKEMLYNLRCYKRNLS